MNTSSATGVRSLARDTVIYGATNIVSKFLNWLLAPFYIRILSGSAEYGIVTNLYAWVSVVLVALTLGLETGLFRFIDNSDSRPEKVYGTCLRLVGISVSAFLSLGFIGIESLSELIGYPDHPEFIGIFLVIIGLDALLSVPFAYLRYAHQAVRFSFYKFLFIVLNIAFNLFFLVLCPYLHTLHPELISWFYHPDYGVGYIFISNLLASSIEAACMFPVVRLGTGSWERSMVRPLLMYCYPLVLLGLAGNFNKMAGQILLPHLYADRSFAMSQLGIYGGCLKIAVVMVMFMQAFRFAYDPFVFARMKATDSFKAYRIAMNYFLLFTCLIFLGVMYYIDLFKHIVSPEYYEGLRIVPIVMAGEILFGIYYNLSMWYKLSDRTYFGAIFSFIGLFLTVGIILVFTPRYGYVACAWASFVCNLAMMLLSYAFGRKYYPIPYDTLKLLALGSLAALCYFFGMRICSESLTIRLGLRTLLLAGYALLSLRILETNVRTLLRAHTSS